MYIYINTHTHKHTCIHLVYSWVSRHYNFFGINGFFTDKR